MQTKVSNVRQLWIGSILLSTALSSSAITLGRYSGAGVLGSPLDIRVQAMLSPGEESGDICVSADVLYGETKLSPGAVRATLQRATPDAQASVRVQASVPIDEPVVTVFVRAGCTAPFTRRYVLLADPVSEPARASSAAAADAGTASPGAASVSQLPALPAPGTAAAPAPAPAAARPSGPGRDTAAPGAVAAPRNTETAAGSRPAPAPRARAPRASSVVRKPVAPAPTAPRLELDAIDLSLAIERDPVLKLSPSLLSEPATSEDARAAAARLWRAINASPQDILRDADRLEALSAEVAALRESQTSNQDTISELSSRLEQSRQWQWLVYALGALLVLALLALLWLWRQQGLRPRFADDKAWWAQEGAEKAPARALVQPFSGAATSDLDLDLSLTPDAKPSRLRPLSRSANLDHSMSPDDDDSTPMPLAAEQGAFVPSLIASRSVATEELFDVQQQADFFISLGEDEQAIKVLSDHVEESLVPSPLAYLDLLKIYHRLGRADAYEALRADFNRRFNAGAPAFEQFSDEGRGLESYERALARIQALWPQPCVLDVIEQSIFREEDDPQAEVFDLEAYRELLLLYAMAKDMIERQAIDSKLPRDFERTKVQALKATVRRGGVSVVDPTFGGNTLPMEQQPPSSPNLGLDVNLDDLSEFSAFEASLPDVEIPVEPTAQPARQDAPVHQNSNMIDFEVLDFTPPDEDSPASSPGNKQR
jgi:hypothetical protein